MTVRRLRVDVEIDNELPASPQRPLDGVEGGSVSHTAKNERVSL
jgi:hypothetical protein